MDFISDKSQRVLHVIKNVVSCYDMGKVAAACSNINTRDLGAQAYADTIRRRYPIHTKEATLLSAAYAAHSHEDSVTQDKIAEAADFWDVGPTVVGIRREIASSLPVTKHALDTEVNGVHIQAFPYHDADSLKIATEAFIRERTKLPLAVRESTSLAIKKASEQLGADLGEENVAVLDRSMGLGVPCAKTAARMLLTRKRLARGNPLLAKLAAVVEALDNNYRPDVGKIALAAFNTFDTEAGLVDKYASASSLGLPEDDLFQVNWRKLADERADIVRLTDGTEVDVSKIAWEKVALVDPDIYAACGQGDKDTAKAVLPTWPRADLQILQEMGVL